MPQEIKGLAQKHDRPIFSVGPTGFEWPESPDKETRENFSAALNELLRAKDMNHMDLAKVCYGRQAHDEGEYRPPRNAMLVRSWTMKKAFPSEKHAGWLAMALGVSMAKLLQPKGPYEPLRAKPNGHKARANGNGHAHDDSEPTPADHVDIPLPEGAQPAHVSLKTNEKDARFVDVTVTGTLPADMGLSLYALVHPRRGQ